MQHTRAKKALRAAILIERGIQTAALDLINHYGEALDAAGMSAYKEQIINQFWNNTFESTEAAKAEAKIRMSRWERFKFHTRCRMWMLKMILCKPTAKVKTCNVRGFDRFGAKAEVQNAFFEKNKKIRIWEIQGN